MEEFLKKGTVSNILYAILFFIVGIIMYSSPVTTLSTITYIIEVILILIGVVTVINYVRVESKNDVFSCGFVQGVACILLALFLIANPKAIHSILPIVIGIWMIIGSLSRIQVAIRLTSWNQKSNVLYIVIAVIMFSLGVIVICNPFKTAAIIVQVLGIAIAAYSVFDIIENISVLRVLNKMK